MGRMFLLVPNRYLCPQRFTEKGFLTSYLYIFLIYLVSVRLSVTSHSSIFKILSFSNQILKILSCEATLFFVLLTFEKSYED